MDHHREDIDWQREEHILLRVGLQENEDRMGELLVQQQQMSRWLCRCADCQGLPISAVGLPQPPPYARCPSPEFHTPPIKVHLIEDTKTPPSSAGPIPVPPPAPKSPILFSDAENVPPACCANPPTPRALLQPIEEVVSDSEDSNMVAERLEDRIGEETALSFLTGNNQGRGARRRVVRGLACRSAPYPHCIQAGDHSRPRSFELEGE